MRIYEITGVNRSPYATERFRKDVGLIIATKPDAVADLEEFIEFKRTSPSRQGYGKKDYMFSNGDLAGFWHWHLVFGQLIVIYQMTNDQLQLIAIISHKLIDGPPPRAFGGWLKSLTPSSFTPFHMPEVEPEHSISYDEKEELIKVFWDLASNTSDRGYLEDAVHGQWGDDLMDQILYTIKQPISDDQKWEAILVSFGGVPALTDQIRKILKSTRSV